MIDYEIEGYSENNIKFEIYNEANELVEELNNNVFVPTQKGLYKVKVINIVNEIFSRASVLENTDFIIVQ